MTSTALDAATRVAASVGFGPGHPILIQDTNNAVVWLRPHAVIAKVGRWEHSAEALTREHAVAVVLAADGAPIGPPVDGLGPIRDEETGFVITLWDRLDEDRSRSLSPREIGTSLGELHDALARYPADLPGFRYGLDLAGRTVADDHAMKALPDDDRRLLRRSFDRLRGEVASCRSVERRLHGEAHDGNLLITAAGPRWIDLEGACVGPLEWDLAFLPDEVVAVFDEVDHDLLERLRLLNSARTAIWCWARYEHPDLRWHAKFHLERVRRAEGSRMR